MKVFFYTGRNDNNKSRLSWKMWKIQRSGRKVTVRWGPVIVVNRRPMPAHTLRTQTRTFRTEEDAKKYERRRIADKLNKGYEKLPRRRRVAR